MENPKMEILNIKAKHIMDRIRQMTNDETDTEGQPIADDIYMDKVEVMVRLALFELGE